MDTRYSPVRRSPSNQASLIHAAPRLACVKPVASVHPEPGSNSSLYNISCLPPCRFLRITLRETRRRFMSRYIRYRICPEPRLYQLKIDGSLVFPVLQIYCLCKSFKDQMRARFSAHPEGRSFPRLRLQRYDNSANPPNITRFFFMKITKKVSIRRVHGYTPYI